MLSYYLHTVSEMLLAHSCGKRVTNLGANPSQNPRYVYTLAYSRVEIISHGSSLASVTPYALSSY